ncbi:hypothetical protein [Zhongshania sp. BJYM1]|uniref:hypothetical protein n=1 Tax=Zhongshania aquatica TaxID=2965069 RepID=UPI0022B5090A|nr:hypothetical protein [Marortus sp. BJYM1]
MTKNSQHLAYLISGGLGFMMFSVLLHADVRGFQDRYFADVDGSTWVLQLETNKTFQSMVTAKLQMGGTRNRYLLIGGLKDSQITGSYKPLIGNTDTYKEERRFEINRLNENSLRLTLSDENGKAKQSLTFNANAQQTPIDTAILGTWLTDAEPAGSLKNPYSGEQWTIRFMEDGTLCENSYTVDTREPQIPKDPCLTSQEQRWKAIDGKVYTTTGSEDWTMQFNYRLMGGRMVVSYPGGKRRVANMTTGFTLSADNR